MTVQQSNVQAQGLPSYRFQGLRGQALADETGKPLVGVSVFAWWGPDGVPDPLPKVARVAEAETRTDGKFELASWEAALSVPIGSEVPRLMFWAPGREWARADSPYTFRFRIFAGTPTERAVQLKEQAMALAFLLILLYGEPTPRIVSALDREWQGLPVDVRGAISPSVMYDGLLRSTRYGYEQEILKSK